MKHFRDTAKGMRLLLGIAVMLLVAACASIGNPEGGPVDEMPPVFMRSNPAPMSVNIDRQRLSIEFNENVQVKDPISKVTVSPAQVLPPRVSAVGRKVTVELRDTLQPNTTYTIDFADAISDLNEGNEIDGFALAFSTGPEIDTLCISGMVFQASNLEPAQGMIVGAYSNLSDTAIRTLPLERITKTNQYGQFTLRGLKEGSYRIYALNDMNRDYKWDRTEDVAFYDVTLTPSTTPTTVSDTLTAADGTDSIVMRPATRFLPDDVLLTWFNENYKSQYLMKYDRPDRRKLVFQFGAPADTFPAITLLNGPGAGRDISQWARVDASQTLDTLEYWITDTAVLELDTINVAARFLRTDTLDRLSWGTDTLRLILKGAKKQREEAAKKREAELKKKEEEAKKRAEEAKKLGVPIDSLPPLMEEKPEQLFAALSFSSPTTQDLNKGLIIKSAVPIARFDTSMVHMQMLVDTLWTDIAPPLFSFPDSLRPMVMTASYTWEPGTKYKITIDSLAMTDIYGYWNKPVVQELTTRKVEDYGVINFNISGVSGPAMVELLNGQDAPIARESVKNGRATFRYIMPGNYYARLWLDANDNGKYDGGLLDSIQPEEVYYFPKKLSLKKNWDIDQSWDIYETPIDQQKPNDIKKNKPKLKRGEQRSETDEDEEDYDPTDPFGNRGSSSGNRGSSSGNSGNNPFGGFGGKGNSLQQIGGLRR